MSTAYRPMVDTLISIGAWQGQCLSLLSIASSTRKVKTLRKFCWLKYEKFLQKGGESSSKLSDEGVKTEFECEVQNSAASKSWGCYWHLQAVGMKEKVFYVVNETETETRRERHFLNLWNFERSTRTCSSRSSACICKSRIDEQGFLFVPRKRSRNLFVWHLFCTESHLWLFFCEKI